MNRLIALSILCTVAVSGACAAPEQGADASVDARYVEADRLMASDEIREGDVLTSVELRSISAERAEALLRPELPPEVRVGRTGRTDALLLQGPAEQVAAAIRVVRRADS